jgi:hypothetical protein
MAAGTAMTAMYILLLRQHDKSYIVAVGKDNQYIVAFEGNQHLLEEMGQRLLEEGLITAYQLATIAGPAYTL